MLPVHLKQVRAQFLPRGHQCHVVWGAPCCSLPTPDIGCRSWSYVQCLCWCLASTPLFWPIVGSSQCLGETDGVGQECLLADSLGWGLVFLWKWCRPQQPTHHGMTRKLVHQWADPWCCQAILGWWFPWAHSWSDLWLSGLKVDAVSSVKSWPGLCHSNELPLSSSQYHQPWDPTRLRPCPLDSAASTECLPESSSFLVDTRWWSHIPVFSGALGLVLWGEASWQSFRVACDQLSLKRGVRTGMCESDWCRTQRRASPGQCLGSCFVLSWRSLWAQGCLLGGVSCTSACMS